ETALLSRGAGEGEATAAAAALGESMAATSGVLGSISTTLAAIPGWGWAAMAALAVLGSGAFKGETRSGASYAVDSMGEAYVTQGPSGGEIAASETRNAIASTYKAINDALQALGSTAQLTEFV